MEEVSEHECVKANVKVCICPANIQSSQIKKHFFFMWLYLHLYLFIFNFAVFYKGLIPAPLFVAQP